MCSEGNGVRCVPFSGCHGVLRHGVVAVLSLALLAGGCTTQKAIDMSTEALGTALRTGVVAPVGEPIVIVTADGAEHAVEFVEADADADMVRGTAKGGELVAVPIAEIVGLRTREEDRGKTALVVVAALAVVAAMGALLKGAKDVGEDLVRCGVTLGTVCP